MRNQRDGAERNRDDAYEVSNNKKVIRNEPSAASVLARDAAFGECVISEMEQSGIEMMLTK